MYDSVSTIRQGVKVNADTKVLKPKLALNWTGPYEILAVGPCSAAETSDGSPLGSNLLCFESPFRPGRFGRSSACGHQALKTLRQPPRQREHAQIPTGGVDAVRAQQFFQEKSPP